MQRDSYTRLTLALDIVKKLKSGPLAGYHELGVIKQQINLHDTIELEPAPVQVMECNNQQVPCDDRNLCWRAVELVKKEYHIDTPVRIYLHKQIPVMGGLAGGSANAATTLQLASDLWELNLSKERLMELGQQLGMDIPFYFVGGTAFDDEISGKPVAIPTAISLVFVLALPGFGVATPSAYRNLDYRKTGKKRHLTDEMRKNCLAQDRQGVVSSIHNDFELTVFSAYPSLAAIKSELLQAGCEAAVLSGSGSTVIGIAADYQQATAVQARMSCRTIIATTLQQ